MAALSEIGDTSGRDVMEIDTSVLQKLLAALNECTEWGQVREWGARCTAVRVVCMLWSEWVWVYDSLPLSKGGRRSRSIDASFVGRGSIFF